MSEEQSNNKKFAKWHGIPRKKVKWHPSVDESKCIGCGMCVLGCGRNVYDFDFKRNKTVVKNPFNCMVGCTTCQVTCLQNAISFPEKDYVRKIIKKNNLILKSKKELLEMKKSKVIE